LKNRLEDLLELTSKLPTIFIILTNVSETPVNITLFQLLFVKPEWL